MNNFNQVPEFMRKISMGTFLELIFKNRIIHTEIRQPNNWMAKPYGVVDIKMFKFPDQTGVIIAPAYIKGIVQYFYFRYGCEHEYIMESKGDALKEFTCKKCNHKRIVDSSD
jgi:hypothetical protein